MTNDPKPVTEEAPLADSTESHWSAGTLPPKYIAPPPPSQPVEVPGGEETPEDDGDDAA